MLKTAENSSENRRIFDEFLAIFSIFGTPGKVRITKMIQKS